MSVPSLAECAGVALGTVVGGELVGKTFLREAEWSQPHREPSGKAVSGGGCWDGVYEWGSFLWLLGGGKASNMKAGKEGGSEELKAWPCGWWRGGRKRVGQRVPEGRRWGWQWISPGWRAEVRPGVEGFSQPPVQTPPGALGGGGAEQGAPVTLILGQLGNS